jgi:uncharacterized phage protein gp47/JayE
MSVYDFKNYGDLLNESLVALTAQTKISQLGPGSKARALLEIINSRLAAAYQYIDQRLANALLASATGIYLDFLGDILACPRQNGAYGQASATAENVCFYVVNGVFGDLNQGNDILVPAGTIVSTETSSGQNSVVYEVIQDTILSADASLWYVGVSSTLVGKAGAVGAGALTTHNLNTFPGLLVKNIDSIANGVDPESDESYRYRLSKQVTASARANETAVRLACLAIPGVANVLIHPYSRGAGSFDIFVISTGGTTDAALLALVQDAINNQQALGINGIARAPIPVGIQFQAQVYPVRALNSLEAAVVQDQLLQAATIHFSTFVIGQSFIVNNLLADLINASPLVKTIGTPGKPMSQLFVWKPSVTNAGRKRYSLTGNYITNFNELVQIEVQSGLAAADFHLVT